MKGKKIKIIALLFLTGIFILAGVMWLMRACATSPKLSHRTLAAINCHTVGSYLLKYYREVRNKTPTDMVPDFVTYVTDPEKKLIFTREPPIEPYTSRSDVGFFLLLPDELESARPVLIGYTTSVSTKTGEVYRGVLFLRGKEIAVVTLQEKVLKNIVGSKGFENKKPDFYIWRQRLNYLQDQRRNDTTR
jgi:hypothetical protein